MEKKFEDGELDDLIDEQFIKEAQMMEKALFSDDDIEDYEATEEEIRSSYEELVARLKADGIYREDEDASRTAENPDTPDMLDMPDTAEKVVSISGKKRAVIYHKLGKLAGFAVACVICVIGVSFTSEANRNYFVENLKIWSGDDTRVVVDNDANNEEINGDEYAAIRNIKEQLGVDVPEFLYRPKYFEFYNYEVDVYAQFARMEYKYNDTIIEFGIDKVNESTTSKIDSIHGEELEIVNIESEDIDAVIRKIQDEQDELPNYMARWKKNNVLYYIVGKIELEELSKIVKLISY